MASEMTETGVIPDMLRDIADDLAVVESTFNDLRTDNQRLERENELLRARIEELSEPPYSDDLADAAEDRSRDREFERSADFQARGERD